ncbi:MAG: MotA/TolQ/ExbB proton channel family protein [Steroidobacteraceae bacterium]|nr:MotA/TolQ/ExbB proton channel family protein [Nevskiaceae bacterium]MCP5338937.1 MotA/TolQ/ExbB proton channel family protein [Nevskiaceae bacterium]MCP5359650.1 MotA/TolQ/ExbB proton channel family protein [Nevskiaceae bacterium]MCP5472556.1 MotA/TolQ/ExbB proton channel family protein [Nevskiaceae bacterium]
MEFFKVAVNFFRDGGFFLYPLALIFVVGVAISIERWFYLSKETVKNRALWDEITPLLQQGNFRQALQVAQGSDAQVATVLKYGIARIQHARRREDIEKAMEESLLEIVPRLEKRTHYLSSLANIGMLVGLLGTIIGLIAAFSAVATANPAEKANLLSAAISVAMNNTASGLFVAITLLFTHMILETKTTSLVDSLEIAVVKFLNAITERQGDAAAAAPAVASKAAPQVPPRPAPPGAPARSPA